MQYSIDISFSSFMWGTGTINGVLTTNAGSIWPGLSPGILTLNSDYIQTETGQLVIEFGGTVPGEEHDQLIINGNATLGGSLVLAQYNGFELGDDVPVSVIQATSFTGDFDQVILVVVARGELPMW